MTPDSKKLPDYLTSTYRMLECAFPKGISEGQYFPLLKLLGEQMSLRNIADTVSVFTGKSFAVVYNEILISESINIPASDAVEKVRELLLPCGYEAWTQEGM